jgi:zinc/manganese transport system substrate-binding protein
MKKRMLAVFALLIGCVAAVEAAPRIVATTSSMGMLAREIGGEQVRVTVLVPPDRDAHYLRAKPSMARALRGADLIVSVGGDLEVGWLPLAIRNAANPRIQPGQPGYFEAAAQVALIDTGQAADRSLGDVHPMGNPHVNLDPQRMARIGLALAEALADLDPGEAEGYRSRARAFAQGVEERLPDWKRRAAGAPGAVLYHRDADYLFRLVNVPILGYIEPVPGIPPSASHLEGLVKRLQGQRGVVIRHAYHPPRGAEFVAKELGWKVVELPSDPPLDASADDYFALIDRWVEVLASAGG